MPGLLTKFHERNPSGNGQQKGLLIALGYSGGDRPGISPGSLYVAALQRKRPTTNATIVVDSSTANETVKRSEF